MRSRVLILVCAICAMAIATPLLAQNAGGAQLHVTVVDETGAAITSAAVRVTPAGTAAATVNTDGRGQASFDMVAAGTVQLHVEAAGFAAYDAPITLRRGSNNQNVTLKIAGLQEEVVVNEDTTTDDRTGNSMTTVLNEEDIAGLPDDPDELADMLDQLSGGTGAIFQVNGFRGGRLPEKSEILQIRFHLNSYSADNHDAGHTIVEIITKPTKNWGANANLGLRSDVLDARNAFARVQTPEELRRYNAGLRGPIVKGKTSIRFNVDGNNSFDSGTIVAQVPGQTVADLVKRPVQQTNMQAAIEHALSNNKTLRIDYRDLQNTRSNLGVGNFNLMDRAYDTTSHQHVLRTQVQGLFGKKLNDFRVQFQSSSNASASLSSAPTIVVIDAFSSGGGGVSNSGTANSLQIADDLDFSVGKKHSMRAGFIVNRDAYSDVDAQNAAGTFTFGSLGQYLSGQPNTFTQRLGQVRTSYAMTNVGLYWQDDVRLNRVFSYSMGLREEAESHVSGVFNPMPRVGFTYTPRSAKVTIRGGYGLFHDWYDSGLYDQTLRVNGVAQRDLLILNPGYPDPFTGTQAVVLPGGRVQASPDLKLPYEHQASIGIERAVTKALNLQATYTMIRGGSQLRSVNVNAPDASGARPEPGVGTVTQIESTGKQDIDRLMLNANYRIPSKRILLSANYTLGRVTNDSDNALQLPANSRDPNAEWGPGAQDIRHRFNAIANFPMPMSIRANITALMTSAPPYNIITGRDDNGDGVVNDRPAGVDRNSARGSGSFNLNVRLTRGLAFGGARTAAGQLGPAQIAPPPPGAPAGPGGVVNQRFNVDFYVAANNILNRVNFLNYSGNLLSPFYGQPTAAAAARRIEVGANFRF